MTTKIWSLFQYPPKLELAAAAGAAFASPSRCGRKNIRAAAAIPWSAAKCAPRRVE
jgi:hypothetical protein